MGSGILIIYIVLFAFLSLGAQIFLWLTKGRIVPLSLLGLIALYPLFIVLGGVVFIGHLCMTILEKSWNFTEKQLKKYNI